MRESGMVIECESRKHKFLLGLTDDGYRDCPICSERLRGPREAFSANEIYGMKTIGQAWREKRKAKSNNKPKQPLSISVDMDTDKMQLKLRAIAKHAEALADELDAIDSNECTELSAKQIELLEHMIELNKQNGMSICSCDVERVLKLDDELPTRLEGSD